MKFNQLKSIKITGFWKLFISIAILDVIYQLIFLAFSRDINSNGLIFTMTFFGFFISGFQINFLSIIFPSLYDEYSRSHLQMQTETNSFYAFLIEQILIVFTITSLAFIFFIISKLIVNIFRKKENKYKFNKIDLLSFIIGIGMFAICYFVVTAPRV